MSESKGCYAWVVEKGDAINPMYACVIDGFCLGWTDRNDKAIRFCRKEDANSISEIMEDADRVAEHFWEYCE